MEIINPLIVLKLTVNYSGKYIFYGDKKFEGNSKGVDELYNLINGN